MAGSPAFALIRRAVLAAARSIPAGRLSTSAALGLALNLPARHVAFILAKLSEEEAELVPSHRMVPSSLRLRATAEGRRQAALLRSEGVNVDADLRVVDGASRLVDWPDTWRATVWADETEFPVDALENAARL